MAESEPKEAVQNFKMKPSLSEAFPGVKIKNIIRNILADKLQGKTYNLEDVRRWTPDIADEVNTAVRQLMPESRYKHVVQVVIGQQLGSGCRYFAKCCWDAESDTTTSETFKNASLFCVCTVFGAYSYC